MTFFNRVKCDQVILRTQFFPYLAICWLPWVLIVGVGYGNFGRDFFDLEHLMNQRDLLFHPVFSIIILSAFLAICLFQTVDLLLSKRCLLGIRGNQLVLLRRKLCPLSDIDIDNIRLGGRFHNIACIPRFGDRKDIDVPLIATDLGKYQAIELIKKALTEMS